MRHLGIKAFLCPQGFVMCLKHGPCARLLERTGLCKSTHTHSNTGTHTCKNPCTCLRAHAHAHVKTHAHARAHTRTHTRHAHAHTNKHKRMHRQTCTYAHIHAHSNMCVLCVDVPLSVMPHSAPHPACTGVPSPGPGDAGGISLRLGCTAGCPLFPTHPTSDGQRHALHDDGPARPASSAGLHPTIPAGAHMRSSMHDWFAHTSRTVHEQRDMPHACKYACMCICVCCTHAWPEPRGVMLSYCTWEPSTIDARAACMRPRNTAMSWPSLKPTQLCTLLTNR